MNIPSLILDQLKRYPALHVQDLVKALYQREFGCGHLITDPERGLLWLTEELHACQTPESDSLPPLFEPLGDRYCRVHLQAAAACGLSAGTLFRLFELSAGENSGSMESFLGQLDELETLIRSGEIPLSCAQAQPFLASYRQAGCPPTHHSEAFRKAYHPAYRVIRNDYARFLDLFAAIDKRMEKGAPCTVAIEGGSATGKSTLARLLSRVYDCNVFHMDDFFLQMHQRTPERFSEPGGNVDYERFLQEVLLPLSDRRSFSYRPFDCSSMSLSDAVHVGPKQLSIIEGAYSMHPALSGFYDFSVFLKIDAHTQSGRILLRNGPEMQQRFLNEWIPLEKRYFEHFRIEDQCDLIIRAE